MSVFIFSAAIAGLWALSAFTVALFWHSFHKHEPDIETMPPRRSSGQAYPNGERLGYVRFGAETGSIASMEFRDGKLRCATFTRIENTYPAGQQLDIEIYGVDAGMVHTVTSFVSTGTMTMGDTLRLDIDLEFSPQDTTRDDRWVLIPEKDGR